MLNLYASRVPMEAWYALTDAIRQSIAAGRHAYLVVPSQFTVEAEQALFAALDTPILMKAQVKSFRSLVRDILQEGSGLRTPVLTEEGRRMLVRSLLESKKEEREVFTAGTIGTQLVDDFVRQMQEWKEYGIDSQRLQAEAEKAPENHRTRRKFAEIAAIYEAYEEALGNIRLDGDDQMRHAFAQLSEVSVFDGVDFFFDRFHSMSKIEGEALAALEKTGHTLHVSVTMDPGMARTILSAPPEIGAETLEWMLSEKTDDAAAFSLSTRFVRQLAAMTSVTLRPVAARPATPYQKQALQAAQAVFALKTPPHPAKEASASNDQKQGIRLVSYRNTEQEVDGLVVAMKKLVAEEGAHFSDIAVFLTEQTEYASMLKRAFHRDRIRFFYDEVKEVAYHPLLRTIRALLALNLKGPRPETMLAFLKAGLLGVEEEEIEIYQRFIEERHIRYGMFEEIRYFTADPTRQFRDAEEEARYRHPYDVARRVNTIVLERLHFFARRIETAHRVKDFAAALVETLRTPITQNALFAYGETLQSEGEEERLAIHERVWSALMERLDEMVELFADKETDLALFAGLCEEGLAGISLGVIPPFKEQVFVGDLLRSRMQPRKYVFILGMTDAWLPGMHKETWLLSEEEKALVLEKGEALPSMQRFAVEEERLNFYSVLQQATERLTLSTAMQDSANASMTPSHWLLRMKECLGLALTVQDTFGFPEILYSRGLILKRLPALLREEDTSPAVRRFAERVLSHMKALPAYRELAETLEREGAESPERPLLPQEITLALYPSETISASQLECFAACPYQYFVRYGLRARESEDLSIQALDIGSILHAAVDQWTTLLPGYLEQGKLPDFAASEAVLLQAGDASIQAFLDAVKRNDPKNAFMLDLAKETMRETHARLLSHLAKSKICRVDHEYSFGPGRNLPGIVLAESPRSVLLEGRMDRVDTIRENAQRYVEVIDYKTGNTGFDLTAMMSGTRLQLPLYLKAASQNGKPLGAFYFPVHAPAPSEEKEGDGEMLLWPKELKLSGFMSRVPVGEALDERLAESAAASVYQFNGNGKDWTKRENVLTQTEMERLLQESVEKAQKLTASRESGYISAHPVYWKISDSSRHSGCHYCPYAAICRFERLRQFGAQRILPSTDWKSWKAQQETEPKGGEA